MIRIFSCRRSSLAFVGIVILTVMAYTIEDVAITCVTSIAGIILAIAGANAYQGSQEAKHANLNAPDETG